MMIRNTYCSSLFLLHICFLLFFLPTSFLYSSCDCYCSPAFGQFLNNIILFLNIQVFFQIEAQLIDCYIASPRLSLLNSHFMIVVNHLWMTLLIVRSSSGRKWTLTSCKMLVTESYHCFPVIIFHFPDIYRFDATGMQLKKMIHGSGDL